MTIDPLERLDIDSKQAHLADDQVKILQMPKVLRNFPDRGRR